MRIPCHTIWQYVFAALKEKTQNQENPSRVLIDLLGCETVSKLLVAVAFTDYTDFDIGLFWKTASLHQINPQNNSSILHSIPALFCVEALQFYLAKWVEQAKRGRQSDNSILKIGRRMMHLNSIVTRELHETEPETPETGRQETTVSACCEPRRQPLWLLKSNTVRAANELLDRFLTSFLKNNTYMDSSVFHREVSGCLVALQIMHARELCTMSHHLDLIIKPEALGVFWQRDGVKVEVVDELDEEEKVNPNEIEVKPNQIKSPYHGVIFNSDPFQLVVKKSGLNGQI
eukprot:Platyproteum_vivax@DN16523_c0_g1_i1.p1